MFSGRSMLADRSFPVMGRAAVLSVPETVSKRCCQCRRGNGDDRPKGPDGMIFSHISDRRTVTRECLLLWATGHGKRHVATRRVPLSGCGRAGRCCPTTVRVGHSAKPEPASVRCTPRSIVGRIRAIVRIVESERRFSVSESLDRRKRMIHPCACHGGRQRGK